MKQNLGRMLSKRAFLSPEAEAYVGSARDDRLTFRELNETANQLGNALKKLDIQKGDRVGLLLMNSSEFMEAYYALAKIGAVVVPLNWRLVADELEYILKDSGTRTLIFDDDFTSVVEDIYSRGSRTDIKHWLQVERGQTLLEFAKSYHVFRGEGDKTEPTIDAGDKDMLYIMYTSGTTGLPKGVVHTHETAIWGILTIAATTYYRESDRYLAALPMFHVGALTPLAVNVYRGATSVVMRSFNPESAWELIDRERINTGLMVPAMLNFMLQVQDFQTRYDHSNVRWIMTGAAPVPVALTETYLELGISILQVYGLTETCGPACLMDPDNVSRIPGSTGKSFFHTEVRVVREDQTDCAPDEAGEVWVAGPHIMKEYWNNSEATDKTIADGWLRTGDIATIDIDGYVFIQDRLKDMIISGGENVYPAEIEAVLMTHPEILEAAVIGQESEKWGESPLAIVVRSSSSVTAKQVLEYCQGKLAGYKQPKQVEFIDEIPRNPSGKILKRLLREDYPESASE